HVIAKDAQSIPDVGAELNRLAQHGGQGARLVQPQPICERSERIDCAAASAHLGSHDLQVGAEMAVLPSDLATDAVQGGFEAKPSVDTYDQKVEHVGKGDSISQMQYPFASRDVGIGPHNCEQDDDRRQTELQVPFAIDHELFGDEDRDCKNHD